MYRGSVAGWEWVTGDTAALIKTVMRGLVGPMKVNAHDFTPVAPIPMPPPDLDGWQAQKRPL